MALVQLNGVAIPTFKDSLRETTIHTGDLIARGINGALHETRSGRKRQWSFQMTPQRATIAEQYRMWIEGFGQGWSFDYVEPFTGQSYSRAGLGNATVLAGGLVTGAGKHSNYCEVGSADEFGFFHLNKVGRPSYAPTMGWTHIFWKYMTLASGEVGADGWYHCILKGAVSHAGGAGANPANVLQYRNGVASSNMGRLITADGTSAMLRGKRALVADTSAGARYDDWLFLPWEIDASWVSSLYTFANSYPLGMSPVTKLSGDCVFDTSPIEVIGRVDNVAMINAKLPGASSVENNVRIMDVTLYEV